MEVQEEAMASKEYTKIMTRKRTKRPRQPSPLALTMASSSSSTIADDGGGFSDNSGRFDRATATATTSLTNSAELTDSAAGEEEEEAMANCLILLAQGRNRKPSEPAVVPAINAAVAGQFVYQCKTCDRCFPSFQALGGHRASHNKPKAAIAEEEKKKKSKPTALIREEDEEDHRIAGDDCTALSLRIPNGVSPSRAKSRVHECSICGAEFSSGQALGGHMRRHRSNHPEPHDGKKTRNILALDLDLNLPPPPPEDDHHSESKFAFASSKEQVIVFSASSLVDCHY